MRKLILIVFLAYVILIIESGCNASNGNSSSTTSKNQNQLTQKEKLEDFEYMYTILKENYPFFEVNKRLSGIDWLGNKDEYMHRIKLTKNDEDYCEALISILSELHNGHTNLLNSQDYVDFCKLYSADIPWTNQLNNSKAVDRYYYGNDTETPKISFQSDRYNKDFNAKTTNLKNQINTTSDNVKTEILSKTDKIAYIKISSFNKFKMNEDLKIIKPFLNRIKGYTKLIIDIRGNGGGTDTYWQDNIVPMLINKPVNIKYYFAYKGGTFEEEFIKYKLGIGYEGLEQISSIKDESLKNSPPELLNSFKYYFKYEKTVYPIDSINFTGKIYLIINDEVGSSADGFASFAKSTGFATLIGEKTFGGGIGQDPLVCVLPNSGYVFRFPMVMGLAADGTCNEEFKTAPDVEVSQVWYRNLFKDKSVDYVLKGKIEVLSIQELAFVILIIFLFCGIIYLKIRLKTRR